MIKSDFIVCGMVLGAFLTLVSILSVNPMTATAQNTTGIINTTKSIQHHFSWGYNSSSWYNLI